MALLLNVVGAILVLVTGTILHSSICLLWNYTQARKVGVPIRVIPVDHINPIWYLVSQQVVSLLKRLGFNNNITTYNYLGFEIPLRWKSHEKLGDTYILCSPSRNWLYLGSPDTITTMMRRPNDFPHDSELTAMLDVFGPNISTAQGSDWKKMRKLVSSCFSDSNFEPVWRESVAQAVAMGKYWSSCQPFVDSTAHDTRTLSINVMSKAGFGMAYPFKGHHETQLKLQGSTLSYKDALQMILENSIMIMMLGTKFLAKPWLPQRLRKLHYACASFQGYMTELYEAEKQASDEKSTSERQHNLMTSLVRASQKETEGRLTESEIYGNMFVFNFAGHDTTAHSFVWIIYFLAGNPEVQDWLYEEIEAVLDGRSSDEWSYRTEFPRLKRCLSIVYETLRLYSPVGLAKWTGNSSTTLQVGEGEMITIPPKTMVVPSHISVQSDPRFWGHDSLVWRPSRWVKPGAAGNEEFITPARGTFLSWSDGVRDCPGRKFAQVEAVATIAALLKEYRVGPAVRDGETEADARKRVLDFIVEDTGMVLLVQLLHPERCPLVWAKR